jgi:hypothetical protein
MLYGLALKYYFTHLKDLTLLENVCASLKSYFKGDEYKRDILSKWNAITLKQVATQGGLDTGQAFQKRALIRRPQGSIFSGRHHVSAATP